MESARDAARLQGFLAAQRRDGAGVLRAQQRIHRAEERDADAQRDEPRDGGPRNVERRDAVPRAQRRTNHEAGWIADPGEFVAAASVDR